MGSGLPWELIIGIVQLVLDDCPRCPTSLILVNSSLRDLCLTHLHSGLRFCSVQQLDIFVNCTTYLKSHPKSLSVILAGGTADHRLFKLLHGVVRHCLELLHNSQGDFVESNYDRLNLQKIYFCLNSLSGDNNIKYLEEALILTDPEEFTWIGPDPGHHFSTAIVPIAIFHLFYGFQTWTRLRHLILSNVAYPPTPSLQFSNPGLPRALGLVSSLNAAQTPERSQCIRTPLSHLETVYLGQVTFLLPSEIASLACAQELTSLRSIRVVDAYQGSIWGPRVRLPDIEKAVTHIYLEAIGHSDSDSDSLPGNMKYSLSSQIRRVRSLVTCEGETERIMGGDRMDMQ